MYDVNRSSPEEHRNRKLAADSFILATKAMEKNDWDAAIELLAGAAELHPDNLIYRQAVVGCQWQKDQNKHSGGDN